MEIDSVLFVDTDPTFLEELGRLIFRALPGVELTVCLSARQTAGRLSRFNYSMVIAAARLIQGEDSILLQQKWKRHALVPLVITAGHWERELARDALLGHGAFDMIAKPIQPTEAVGSLQLALWQGRFLKLVTQRAHVVSHFERHLAGYLKERNGGLAHAGISKRVKETLTLVRKCTNIEDLYRLGPSLLGLAEVVQERTLGQALERLESVRLARA